MLFAFLVFVAAFFAVCAVVIVAFFQDNQVRVKVAWRLYVFAALALCVFIAISYLPSLLDLPISFLMILGLGLVGPLAAGAATLLMISVREEERS